MKKHRQNRVTKPFYRTIALLTSIVLTVSALPASTYRVSAESEDTGKKIEILISSESGTDVSTDEYKQQLLDELVKKGIQEENVRFIDSLETIKTNNLDMGWLVYDHLFYQETNNYYYDSVTRSYVYDTNVYTSVTAKSTEACKLRDRHIYSLNGGKEMTFLGYGVPGYKDFAIYPNTSTDTKVVNFDIAADKVDTHTLEGSGFLVNAGVDSSGILKAYLLFYKFSSPTSGMVYLLKVNQNANTMSNASSSTIVNGLATTVGTGVPFTIDSTTKKINVNMIVSPDKIECTYSQYTKDANNNLVKGSENALFNYQIAQANQTGYNGFGPLVSYTSHNCNVLTMFTFSNLAMSVNTSADNALKQTTWSDDENVAKFYVNITDKGLAINDNADSMLTSMIDNSVYYIGAGTSGSTAQTDADKIADYTGGSTFVPTTPGTQDDTAVEAIADAIIKQSGQDPVQPLILVDLKEDEGGQYVVTVTDDTPDITGEENYEVVYEDETGVHVEPVTGTPVVDENSDPNGTIEINIAPDILIDADWCVLRRPVSPEAPSRTPAKLISTSDAINPVVAFNIINDTTNNEVISYDLKDGSTTLSILDKSYSNSVVDFDSSVSQSYKITSPSGAVVSTNGSVNLTASNAVTGDYQFTETLTVTKDGVTSTYVLTKKIAVYNDNTAPTVSITNGPNNAAVTTTKNVTITLQDSGSGLASYAIVASTDGTCPDVSSQMKSVSSKDSVYYDVSYTLPLTLSGTVNIYVVAVDKSGNTFTGKLDSYTVSADIAALAAINAAPDVVEMASAIQTYAGTIGLDITDYSVLNDKSPVLQALISPVFTTKAQVITAFNTAVETEKAAEELAAAKIAAKQAVEEAYNQYEPSDYSVENWNQIIEIKETAEQDIDSATSIATVNEIKDEAITAMDEVLTIDELIADAVELINTITTPEDIDLALYTFEDLLGIDLTGYEALEDSTPVQEELMNAELNDREDLIEVLNAAIDKEKAAEELAAAKEEAKAELAGAFAEYDQDAYSPEKWNDLNQEKVDGDAAIDAANTVAQVQKANDEATAAMDNVKTAEEELADAKQEAKDQLAAIYATYTEGDYPADNWTVLTNAKTDGDNAIDSADTIADVTTALEEALNKMDVIKPIAEIIADAVNSINQAADSDEMSDVLESVADLLGLDLTQYNDLDNNIPVLEELVDGTYANKEAIKAALDDAVATQQVKEALAERISDVTDYVDSNPSDAVNSDDAADIYNQINEIEDILTQDEYLTDDQMSDLIDLETSLESYLQKLADIEEVISDVDVFTDSITDEYITTKTIEQLEEIADIIDQMLEMESNLTDDEIANLQSAAQMVENALIVKEKKAESVVNETKDPFVLLLENQVELLPDPDTATDTEIKDSETEIVSAKEAFDNLGDKVAQVSTAVSTKLDKLINRLARINIKVDAAAAKTDVSATGLGLLITDEDLATGEDVQVTLTVVDKTEENPNKDAIMVIAGDDVIGAYFDINLYKQIGALDPERLRELNTTVAITIAIPENIRGKDGYKVVRVHNGVAEILNTTQNGNTLTFETDKFSTYAIIYDQAAVTTTETQAQAAVSPNTGDNAPIVLWAAAMSVSVITYGAYRRKKA